LVGRETKNYKTKNMPYSFMGVQLGNERKILPTAYSIKNGNSITDVMLSWRLEGSNDLVNWVMLDARVHNP
jgi:hypothetical protein